MFGGFYFGQPYFAQGNSIVDLHRRLVFATFRHLRAARTLLRLGGS